MARTVSSKPLQLPGTRIPAWFFSCLVQERVGAQHAGNVFGGRIEIEQFPALLHDREYGTHGYAVECQRYSVLCIAQLDNSGLALDHDRSEIAVAMHDFDAWYRAGREEAPERRPVERLPVRQFHRERRFLRDGLGAGAPELARRPAVGIDERIVEAAHAAVACRNRYILHRQRGLVDQLFGKMQALGMRDRERARPEVPGEQPAQVPAGNTESGGEIFDVALVERAVCDQPQSAPHGRRSASPCGRTRSTLGTASQARPETRFAGRRGRWKEQDVLALRCVGGTDRAAINSGRSYADEKLTVETRIAGQPGSFVDFVLQHGGSIRPGDLETSQNRTCMCYGCQPSAVRFKARRKTLARDR